MSIPFDATAAFLTNFKAELAERGGDTDPKDFRAAGRRTKAKPNGEDALFWTTEGPRLVQAYIDWRETTAWSVWTLPDGSPAIELDITSNFLDVPVRTIIDRVFETPDGQLVIVDLKSGSSKPDSKLQLEFYGVAVENIFGRRAEFGAYWHARTGGLLELVPLTMTAQDIGEQLQAFRRARAENIYIPHITSMCKGCGVRHACKYVGGADADKYQNYGKGVPSRPDSYLAQDGGTK